MLLKLGIIIFIVLASTVLALFGALLLARVGAGRPASDPTRRVAGMTWLIYDGKQRAPSNVRLAPDSGPAASPCLNVGDLPKAAVSNRSI
jgi:hypothetical protein